MSLQLSFSIFLVACVIASYTDLRWRRVPNYLSYGALSAIVACSIPHGIMACVAAFAAAVAVVFAGSVIFGLGWLGGGDIKLLAAGAAAIGFPHFIIVLLYVAVMGGIIAAFYALHEGRLRTILTNVASSVIAGTNITPAAASRRIPYALAICAGAFCYAASESFAPWFRLVH